VTQNTWSRAADLITPRDSFIATLLPNGKVLVAGGESLDGFGGGSVLQSSELYDPASNTWSATGNLPAKTVSFSGSLLPNGKVLISGGDDGVTTLASAALYDPDSGTWRATTSLNTARYFHTSTLLPNGLVLVSGGNDRSAGYRLGGELYDYAAGSWSATGSLTTARRSHTATLLPNGQVLVTGGVNGSAVLGTSELYDPAFAQPGRSQPERFVQRLGQRFGWRHAELQLGLWRRNDRERRVPVACLRSKRILQRNGDRQRRQGWKHEQQRFAERQRESAGHHERSVGLWNDRCAF
jgi:hypothetical protein